MKLTDQILATAYSATFAVFEPIRDFLPGAPNLFHLRHHYATEGVPLTTADVESSTGAKSSEILQSSQVSSERRFH